MDRFLGNSNIKPKVNSKKTEQGTNSSDTSSFCAQLKEGHKVATKYSTDLAFTITLKPTEYRHTYQEQYKGTAHILTSIFDSNGCKYSMVAELTKQYNIHYHGIMKVPLERGRDSCAWFFDRLRKLTCFGRSECEQVMNYDKWTKYIAKDIKRDLDIVTVIKDDYNILDITLQDSEDESGASSEQA